ncbi:RraA family protein [Roseovarius aquimarinus]|uniref:RraA family protein n=1 Tax=Roseovarius aquimarinus TaxID=1229156 RepID=A0ABW7I5I4_9RHOB
MTVTQDHLAALARFDTPTICNALERIEPATRLEGYTAQSMVAAPGHLRLPDGARAICGRAKTARIAGRAPHGRKEAENNALKIGYYEYVAACDLPTVLVIEDTDADPIGAFWGEVHSALHRALGALGAVTNGVVRDLEDLDPRFLILAGKVAPSHAHVHWVDYGAGATVFGMQVEDGQIIHADRHGAVVIPESAVGRLEEAARAVQARERPLLELAQAEHMDMAALRALITGKTQGEEAAE